jgi:hypothetical protein
MLRELWPVVRVLRREGMSWRRLPKHMHECYGVPVVTHVTYIIVAREKGDIRRRSVGLPLTDASPG